MLVEASVYIFHPLHPVCPQRSHPLPHYRLAHPLYSPHLLSRCVPVCRQPPQRPFLAHCSSHRVCSLSCILSARGASVLLPVTNTPPTWAHKRTQRTHRRPMHGCRTPVAPQSNPRAASPAEHCMCWPRHGPHHGHVSATASFQPQPRCFCRSHLSAKATVHAMTTHARSTLAARLSYANAAVMPLRHTASPRDAEIVTAAPRASQGPLLRAPPPHMPEEIRLQRHWHWRRPLSVPARMAPRMATWMHAPRMATCMHAPRTPGLPLTLPHLQAPLQYRCSPDRPACST